MGSRHPPRRITARTTRCQESAEKNNSKNYQASRICQEELQQELPGLKNPPRRNTARITRHQESAEKNYSKKYEASRIRQEELQQEIPGIKNLPRRRHRIRKWHQDTRREETQPRRENRVQNLRDPALVVSKNIVDVRCDKLPHDICGMEFFL